MCNEQNMIIAIYHWKRPLRRTQKMVSNSEVPNDLTMDGVCFFIPFVKKTFIKTVKNLKNEAPSKHFYKLDHHGLHLIHFCSIVVFFIKKNKK